MFYRGLIIFALHYLIFMTRIKGELSKILIIVTFLQTALTVAGCNNKRGAVISQTDTSNDVNLVSDVDSVSIKEKNDSSLRYIYLTFDDGPQHGTMTCYHICRDLNVKASFFMVGVHADNNHLKSWADSIKRNYPYIFLANHSYTHAYSNHYHKFYATRPSLAELDFVRAQDSLHIPYKITRFPGNCTWNLHSKPFGPKSTWPLARYMDSSGFDIIGWDVEWRFKGKNSSPVESTKTMVKIVDEYMNSPKLRTPNHIVILAHDRMFAQPAAADSLKNFILALKQNPHIVFKTIDQYPGLKKNKSYMACGE